MSSYVNSDRVIGKATVECLRHSGLREAEKPQDLLLCLQNLPIPPQAHANLLPFENSVYQHSSISEMLADFLNHCVNVLCELLLTL